MGVLTYLVSDKTKEYCEMGRLFFGEDVVKKMKKNPDAAYLRSWLIDSHNHFNTINNQDAKKAAAIASEWMKSHPDWKFITDQDEEFDDVYLASDDADAAEYKEVFGEDCSPIYKKTATVWEDVYVVGDDE